MPIKIVQKIGRNIRDYGLVVTLNKSISSGFKPIYQARIYHIYRVDLRKIDIAGRSSRDGIIIRFITSEELDIIRQIEKMAEWLSGKVADKLNRGQKCLAALYGDEVAGFNLISLDRFELPVVRLTETSAPQGMFIGTNHGPSQVPQPGIRNGIAKCLFCGDEE